MIGKSGQEKKEMAGVQVIVSGTGLGGLEVSITVEEHYNVNSSTRCIRDQLGYLAVADI
jgi:hypothetical protein